MKVCRNVLYNYVAIDDFQMLCGEFFWEVDILLLERENVEIHKTVFVKDLRERTKGIEILVKL
jgi:hypothetical protein